MKRARGTYETFVRSLLFSLDPETAHRLTIKLLRAASHFDFALHWLRFFQPPSKPKTLFGLNFPNPIGLAAGLTKTAWHFRLGRRSGLASSRSGPSPRKPSREIP